MLNTIVNKSEIISQVAAWVSGAILFGTSILITVEVILRKVFSYSMGGADEISSYAMAISCSWAFAYALFRKAHIRIDVFYIRLPHFMRYALDIFSLILFGIYMAIFSYFGFHVFLTSFLKGATANTPLHTPLWIPQLIWVLGLVGFTLSIFLILSGTIYNLLHKKFSLAQELSGATTLEEEINEECIVPKELEAGLAGGVR